MRNSQNDSIAIIKKKTPAALKEQGLGYAKLPNKEEDEQDKKKSLKKHHEIYDNTWYIPYHKARVIGKIEINYRNTNKFFSFPSNSSLL